MPAKTRTARLPSPEARDHLWQVIRSSTEPLTVKALARLLLPPHKMTTAELGTILDEDVAVGRLYRLPPASARGAPRYWDRDAAALIRLAAWEAVRRSERPRTARELLRDLGISFKIKEPELSRALNEQVASGAIHAVAPATAKGKPRFWHRHALEFGKLEILNLLEAKGAQTAAALKKTVKGFSESQFQEIIQSAIDSGVLWRHPPIGKSKHELLGKKPPSPEPYLRDVGTQLTKVIAQLQAAQVPDEELRRSVVQLLEAAGIAFAAGPEAKRDGQSDCATKSVDLIALMRRLEPGADRGALVGARDLRRAARLEKSLFDQAILELARQGRLSLHRHDYATSLSSTQRDDLVTDGAGTYYVGMAIRSGGEAYSAT